MKLAPGVGLEPTAIRFNRPTLCQLSYPGMAPLDVIASIKPITRRWVKTCE